jgi:hypothetical protein
VNIQLLVISYNTRGLKWSAAVVIVCNLIRHLGYLRGGKKNDLHEWLLRMKIKAGTQREVYSSATLYIVQ